MLSRSPALAASESLRGRFGLLRRPDKVRGEWSLVTVAWNLKRMFTLCSAH